MSWNLPLTCGQTARTASTRASIRTGVDERTGELLTAATVIDRVRWCAGLVAEMSNRLLREHWNQTGVDTLARGRDANGRKLPSNAWMALRRLAWTVTCEAKTNDRIVRMAQEQTGRTLRSVRWRAELIAGILATWPGDPTHRTAQEWEQVRAAIPAGEFLPSSVIRSRTRQVVAFERRHGHLPSDLFELEPIPHTAQMLLLSACDSQQATIQRSATDPAKVVLRLRLPIRPDPRAYKDWSWVACPLVLPTTVPPTAVIYLPTVRVTEGKIRTDLAYTHAVPMSRHHGHTVALGVDWGLNTLLSAGAAQLHNDGRITALGTGAQFRAAGVVAKQDRLRRLSERLHVKVDHYARLDDPALEGKADALAQEILRVCGKRSRLNDALAWAGARWIVDQAVAIGATVIYLEDLRSLEAKGMGRTHNTRLSQMVRGRIADHTRHLAAAAGISVVTVPAHNTSKHCPRCLTDLRHRKAPDKPVTPGWKWATCPNLGCGWQGDRDQGAWQRIAARGLTHQSMTVTDRSSAHMVIRTVTDSMEARAFITAIPPTRQADRTEAGPPRTKSTHLTPRRREVPSPARLSRRAGQRPEGHVSTDRAGLPRAANRNQSVTTISTPIAGRHRPRGAELGAGFHLHAHACPPRWAQPMPDEMSSMGSLS
ncbi:zinc ribbon domain-containing protein [Nocardia inohanensis]|uniref:zinc ribbon domain-containing protein n=1 Tax=Nocardia inohanensis TaxID=209246 RepID=UPI00082ADA7A|nr:zinc ribbon domain-containing protein [Nocardia inohanensis]